MTIKGKRKKKKDIEESESSEDSEDEDRPKKRGRPRVSGKDAVRGFTEKEIRHFIKSYKKFGSPLTRLDAIACDAELQEKSESDLRKLAEMLKKGCEQAVEEFKHKKEEENQAEGTEKKKTNRGPSFKLGAVTVNAQTVIKAEQDLEPLVITIPSNKEERKKFELSCRVKAVHWDCVWDVEEDSNLLKGIYEYGIGSWEAIKMDPDLNLHDKILPDGGDLKPQGKHLQTRCEYLLKVLKKNLEQEGKVTSKATSNTSATTTKSRKKRKPKSKAEIIGNDFSDSDSGDSKLINKTSVKNIDSSSVDTIITNKKHKHNKKDHNEKHEIKHDEDETTKDSVDFKEKKKKKKEKKAKKDDGPIHITTSETVAIASEEMGTDLPIEVFTKCKEMMRPVKRALKRLDNPDEGLSEKEQVIHTRHCLLKIGDRINECMADYNDPEIIKQWRSYLWTFVSKFTEFDAKKLHKLYKHAYRKREEEKEKEESQDQHGSNDKSQDSKSHKRSHDHMDHHHKSRDGHGHKKRSHQEHWNRDHKNSSSVSNGPRHNPSTHNSTGPVTNLHRSSIGRETSHLADNSSSSADRWQHASPLARAEDQPRKNRYGDSGPSAYNRGQHPHHQEHRAFHGVGGGADQKYTDSHYRFNNDRRDNSINSHQFHRDHNNSSNFSSLQHRHDRPDHHGHYRSNRSEFQGDRSEHHRPGDYGQFGHRGDYGGSGAAGGYPRSGSDGYQSHQDRKRKGDDFYERRALKDPRMMDDHSSRQNSYSNSDNFAKH